MEKKCSSQLFEKCNLYNSNSGNVLVSTGWIIGLRDNRGNKGRGRENEERKLTVPVAGALHMEYCG